MINPEKLSIDELLKSLRVDPTKGLTEEEVLKRRSIHGLNQIQPGKVRSSWSIFIAQFKNLIVGLLVVAALVSFFFEDYYEMVAILAVILINAVIGFILESQANRSMHALKSLEQPNAKVIRQGKVIQIPFQELVPGDLLSVEAGDLIGADARLLKTNALEVNESALTGESLPTIKQTSAITEDVTIGDQSNMIFRGTSVTRGNGLALVVFIGKETQIGNVSSMIEEAQEEELPLNKKLNKFSKTLIWLSFAIMVPFVGIGLLQSKEPYLLIETAIALVVAAIPEGLPIVATIALASGMLRLSKKKVLVSKLAAVETLGSTNIILTDKTGTLTENHLKVLETHPELSKSTNSTNLLTTLVLCNNAEINDHDKDVGDPVEIALLKWAEEIEPNSIHQIRSIWTKTDEMPFESETRIMITFHQNGKELRVSLKGSTTEVLKKCSFYEEQGAIKKLDEPGIQYWMEQTDLLSAKGLKVLAAAYQVIEEPNSTKEDHFILAGLVGLQDPPRHDVQDSIAEFKNAGIRVVMVTGDHPETSKAIAKDIGLIDEHDHHVMQGKDLLFDSEKTSELLNTSVFSRVSPEQKLRLVEFYQSQNLVVAMTGDGVNDAPALKKADIGIAMGLRGTEVAKEAADMILQNDSFTSITDAIKQGRIIFNNIRNFVIFLLSCNLSEILVVSSAAFLNWGSPLLPLQILFLNIVTDVFPALALGMGQGSKKDVLQEPRTINEPILTKAYWRSLIVYALTITLSILGVYAYASFHLGLSEIQTNNVAFFTLAFAQLFHPFNLIKRGANIFQNSIVRNPHLWASIIFCSLLLLGASLISPINQLLELSFPKKEMWNLIFIGSLLPIPLIHFFKFLKLIN
ncbi:cation-transporting P-type ATPase [Algoriphagus lutimaris]|uniref:cation-translocating P-type ATPase n=1 Tax=Algoriphagus lutimaris TaxID=613197 RepID=UPI00196B3B0B|nr:cation-transporting P-type ATPase [Algoriphagus lutimaris]MBN3519875.1 cation-transporting P-type ATPase [Algoriphagus lutimaris]